MTGLVLTRPSVAVTVMFIGQLDVVLTLGLRPHSKDTKKTQEKVCKFGGIQVSLWASPARSVSLAVSVWLFLSKSPFSSHLSALCASLASLFCFSLFSRIFLSASHALPPSVTFCLWSSPPPPSLFLSPEALPLPSLCLILLSSLPLVLSPSLSPPAPSSPSASPPPLELQHGDPGSLSEKRGSPGAQQEAQFPL